MSLLPRFTRFAAAGSVTLTVAFASVACTEDAPSPMSPTLDTPVAFGRGGPSNVSTRGPLLVSSEATGDSELYTIMEDGTDPIRLTFSRGRDDYGSFSPDGNKIAFASRRTGRWQIYVINADGSGTKQLTFFDAPMEATGPVFSPDGKKIAFTLSKGGPGVNDYEIYIMNANGTQIKELVALSGKDLFPTFSPDGKTLAFQSGAPASIWSIPVKGGTPTQLIACASSCVLPNWSPDGSRLAYGKPLGVVEIYDLTAQTVVGSLTNATRPIWSPDGERIAYTGYTNSVPSVYTASPLGTDVQWVGDLGGGTVAWSWSK